MAFCENCGKEISEQAVSCPNCGHPGPGARPMQPAMGPGAIVQGASWWKRLLAIIIDGLVLIIPVGIIVASTGGTLFLSRDPFTQEFNFGPYFRGTLVQGIVFFVYAGVMNGSARGQTVGKMAMRIRVIDATTGGPIDVGRGFIRAIIPAFAGLLCGLISILDGLWPLWDARRQALHDKMANTLVVDVQ